MEKYLKQQKVGEGGYGVVYRAVEKQTGRVVALKKIRVLSSDTIGGVHFTALREVKVLYEVQHENIMRLLDAFTSEGNVYLVYEFLDFSLEDVLRDRRIHLTEADRKAYARMILQGVRALHENWILHRDLKPGNVLISSEGVAKLADFGFARSFGSPDPRYTKQVVTIWYRPPEALYGARAYGAALDMWSVGCVLAELLLREPIFRGNSELEQLSEIFAKLGTPNESNWPGVSQLPNYVPFSSMGRLPPTKLFPGASDAERDLLDRLLRLDPSQRLSAAEALEHPWFAQFPPPTPCSALRRPATAAPVLLSATAGGTAASATAAAGSSGVGGADVHEEGASAGRTTPMSVTQDGSAATPASDRMRTDGGPAGRTGASLTPIKRKLEF